MRTSLWLTAACSAMMGMAGATAAAPRVRAAMPVVGESTTILTVPAATIGQPFYLMVSLDRGLGAIGLQAGLSIYEEAAVVRFVRDGNRILLVRDQMRLQPDGPEAQRSIAGSFTASIIGSTPIIGEMSGGGVRIDIADWLRSALVRRDEWGAEPLGPAATAAITGSRLRSASSNVLGGILVLHQDIAFNLGKPAAVGPSPASSIVTLSFAITLSPVSKTPMPARAADPAVNSMTTETKRIADEPGFGRVERLVLRWPIGTAAATSPTLTFYIDASIPVKYRDVIEAAVVAWNAPFAAIGMPGVVIAKPLPEGADPHDPRYPTIRWIASDRRDFVGHAPVIHDPATGQILLSGVMLDGDLLRRFGEDYAVLGGKVGYDRASGEIVAPDTILRQAVFWMTMHEIGHALGLEHNFRGSAGVPFAALRDPTWVAAHGLSLSVMDYPGLNWLDGPEPGKIFTSRLGAGDFNSIAFGYARSHADATTAAVAARAQPGGCATDAEASATDGRDPFANPWDLSDDPIGWATARAAQLRAFIAAPDPALPPDIRLRLALIANDQLGRLMTLAAKAIGAPDAVAVTGGERAALAFLEREGLVTATFPAPMSTVAAPRANASTWHDIGIPPKTAAEMLLGRVTQRRAAVLAAMFAPARMARMAAREAIADRPVPLPLGELFRSVATTVWKQQPFASTSLRLEWISRMKLLVRDRSPELVAARKLAYAELTRLNDGSREIEPVLAKELAEALNFTIDQSRDKKEIEG